METVRGHENLNLETASIATIGTFDGIHVGHQRIIEATVKAAKDAGLPSLVLTFDRSPREILSPREPVDALTNLEQKLALLDKFDLDLACVLEFRSISKMTPQDFFERVIKGSAKVSHLFVGKNFRFGAGAAGDTAWLKEKRSSEFDVAEFPLEIISEETVSSTRIRDFLKSGAIEKIAPLLGRNVSLPGRVVRGAGRGAGLGFPTANLDFDPSLCLPGRGVYVGYIWHGIKQLPSVINCGTNPTFGQSSFHCEAHVLDSHIELYGQEIEMELTQRIRNEQTFPSPEALTRQITDDVHKARHWFASNPI